VAEYSHGYFPIGSPQHLDYVLNPSIPFVINVWEIGLLSPPSQRNRAPTSIQEHDEHAPLVNTMDLIQRYIFGCDTFTGEGEATPANFYEAADRLT